ncbi:Hypothetical predicted protein [Lecanosticta acicola]|uniref:Uncharacterized protein n=1 Tax=Lecanosticta acicola TaxID=111012 RepID=A0AAI8Z7R3_9PEZI|nr:Hypothetical predicted protein [Lecanosticta acicola]
MSKPESQLTTHEKSQWTKYGDLKKYGWKKSSRREDRNVNSDEMAHTKRVLEALGMPDLTDKSWKLVHWIHKKPVKGTRAYHRALYNPGHGIIIALNAQSVSTLSPLAPLHAWSDITFLTYMQIWRRKRRPNDDKAIRPPPLRYILQLNVISPDTLSTLSHILGVEDLKDYRVPFPGDTIQGVPNSADAKACIGMSNGRGVAYLLAQHKSVFGQTRKIKCIQFWDSDEGNGPRGEQMRELQGIPNILYTLG